MKKIIVLVISCVLCVVLGYQAGISKATTSDGWVEDGSFLLDVDGQLYEWIIDDSDE